MTSVPGVDTKTKTMRGPWSEPTDEVHMPPDVMPYAIGSGPGQPQCRHEGQVPGHPLPPVRRRDGHQELHGGPGEVIGEPGTAAIPSSDGSKTKTSTIDFNSHQIVLDIDRQQENRRYQPLPAGFIGPPIDRPDSDAACCAPTGRSPSITRPTTS